jgi:hypothetical protein
MLIYMCIYIYIYIFPPPPPVAQQPPVGQGLVIITRRHTTLGRTPLDEWPAQRRDLYLTTHNTVQETDIHAPSGNFLYVGRVGFFFLSCLFLWSILYLWFFPSFFISLMFHIIVLIQQTQHKHPCPRWDSNPRCQQAKGPQTHALHRASTGIGQEGYIQV